LIAVSWVGLVAAVLLVANIWPRGMLGICWVCFLSFVSAASEFSGYQSDGMLLEAGCLALFLAPGGWRPGLGRGSWPIRASVWLLTWEAFRIYFESGLAKILSGDPQWRHFTSMDDYYQNGPLPTWIGWYAGHLPHWFHAATAAGTLGLELFLVWMFFLPRRVRIVCFCIVTPWQLGIILTANYAFLNYLVLFLGFFLLDDKFLQQFLPGKWREKFVAESAVSVEPASSADGVPAVGKAEKLRAQLAFLRTATVAILLCWLFYASATELVWMLWRGPLPTMPVVALQPFRVAERYGLFAVMTPSRFEIEFQGSNDGQNWVAYPFRFKPQDPMKAPGIYAPYQPRFDWNLWFASLGEWRSNPMVPRTEERLLMGDKDVLALFAGNPFAGAPPKQVRAVIYQYWFTTWAEKKATGAWWRREDLGLYAPALEREPDGKFGVLQWPAGQTPSLNAPPEPSPEEPVAPQQ
jgi:lipase maturation factor 1